MKCTQCVKKDVCKYYIPNSNNACTHFLGIKGVWELLSQNMSDSVYVTDKFVKMYGEEAIFDDERSVK